MVNMGYVEDAVMHQYFLMEYSKIVNSLDMVKMTVYVYEIHIFQLMSIVSKITLLHNCV